MFENNPFAAQAAAMRVPMYAISDDPLDYFQDYEENARQVAIYEKRRIEEYERNEAPFPKEKWN